MSNDEVSSNSTFSGKKFVASLRHRTTGYMMVAGLVSAALVTGFLAESSYSTSIPLFVFTVSVAVCTLVFGLVAGLCMVALSVMLSDYYFIGAVSALPEFGERGVVLVAFTLEALTICILCGLVAKPFRENGGRVFGWKSGRSVSEVELEAAFEQSVLGLAYAKKDGTLTRVNKSLCDITGYGEDELRGLQFQGLVHPDERPGFVSDMERVRSGAIESPVVEYCCVGGDGAVFWASIAVSRLSNVAEGLDCCFIAVQEITHRKMVEKKLRLANESLEQRIKRRSAQLRESIRDAESRAETLRVSEEHFLALIRNTSDIITIVDREGVIRYESPAMEKVLGFGLEELIGEKISTHVHPDDEEELSLLMSRTMVAPESRAVSEARFRCKDGSYRHLEISAINLLHNASINGIVIDSRDITIRKQVEERLRNSEELYRSVVEQAAENICLVDTKSNRILEANAAVSKSLGYTLDELKEMTIYDIVVDRENGGLDENIQSLARNKGNLTIERCYRRKDGQLVDVELSMSAIPFDDKEALCVVAHDVTQRNQAEERLRQSLGVLLALREAGQILGSTLEAEEIVSRLLEIMQSVSDLTATVITIPDEQENLHVWRSVGLDSLKPKVRFEPDIARARKDAVESGEQRMFCLESDSKGQLSGVFIPLRTRDRVFGVLEAYSEKSLPDEDMVEILGSLATQAASALENARLYRELAERETRLQDLVGRLIEAQEEERRRVAYEVHDELAQVVSAAHQHLEAYAERHPPDSERGVKDLDRVLKMVRRTVSDARRIIANLRPMVLDDFGLAATLSLEAEMLRENGFHVEFVDGLGDRRLPDVLELTLFRAAQESLNNVRKHAQTRKIHISLHCRNEEICLEVRDYGCGFQPSAVPAGGGPGERIGLVGMRERVDLLGGELNVYSRRGSGTSVIATIPLGNRFSLVPSRPDELRATSVS